MITLHRSCCRLDILKERCRFLKKAAQKLLLCWGMGDVSDKAHDPD
jgi:hypothetical protein